MNTSFYKKSGIAIMNIARDFFAMQAGEKTSTILEYTQKFSISRGVVQSAIAALEESGAVRIDKRGVKGTFLVDVDYEKLYPYTGWGAVMGTMPLPLNNHHLSSLTTAIWEEMDRAPFPFSFAYMTGAEKRLEKIREMVFDFMVVSKSTAQAYLRQYDFLEMCISLDGCIYSSEYTAYFPGNNKTQVEDGMRVGIDSKCFDQAAITRQLCKGKDVVYVEFPYIAIEDLLLQKKVDCVVYRKMESDGPSGIVPSAVELEDIPGFSEKETRTPVILSNRNNYGMDKLVRRYVKQEETRRIQEDVLSGNKSMKFY